jgi:hypothetical protein
VNWDALIFQTFAPFIERPLMAFLPAAVFGALYFLNRRAGIMAAALCWAGYASLETLNKARITCSGECNIRVDLLVIYPLLWIVSIVALVLLFFPRKRRGAA